MYRVTVGEQSRVVPQSEILPTLEELGAGEGKPYSFVPVDAGSTVAAGAMNIDGRNRSEQAKAVAESLGHKVAETVYERGSQVNATGVANGHEMRAEFDAMPATRDACFDLVRTVEAEDRVDTKPVRVADLRMTSTGLLAQAVRRAATEELDGPRYEVSPRALSGLVTRLGCGGASYLADSCTPKLRAINVNHQAVALGEREASVASAHAAKLAGAKTYQERKLLAAQQPESVKAVIRTRYVKGARDGSVGSEKPREAYAIVSPGYSALDADRVAATVAQVIPTECRGVANYDGQRTRIEALLHTTVQPEHFVAGEFLRAGVVVTSDDTGAGSVKVRTMILQNLCLNLIILDESWATRARIVHRGSGLADRLREGVIAASETLTAFGKLWGVACETPAVTEEQIKLGREIAAMALFRGVLQRELVQLPGKVEDRVLQLTDAWKGDKSSATSQHALSLASITNAFTRVAHTSGGLDVWQQDEICSGAANLLKRRQPLPFELAE